MSAFNIKRVNKQIDTFEITVTRLVREANRLYRRYDTTLGDVTELDKQIKAVEKAMARIERAVRKIPQA